MPVKIHGKEYLTVADRLATFSADHPEYTISTEILSDDGDKVVVRATVSTSKRTSTGIAEEVRGSTQINRTSALENCETSAVGRALAFMGYAGTEIASANEVQNAIAQQESTHRFKKGERDQYIEQINACLDTGDEHGMKELWHELERDAQMKLWEDFSSTQRKAIKVLLND